MDMRFRNSVAALTMLANQGHVDLSQDDLAFLTDGRVWLAADRNRARRCIEQFSYGALDLIGLPRFPLPAEFVAAVIVKAVHPTNWQTACQVSAGVEWTEDIALNRDNPLKAEVLFSHVLRVAAGNSEVVDDAERKVKQKVAKIESAQVQA